MGRTALSARTVIEVKRLFDNDIAEIDSVFLAPVGSRPVLAAGSPTRESSRQSTRPGRAWLPHQRTEISSPASS